jgi:hypothetical protein
MHCHPEARVLCGLRIATPPDFKGDVSFC